MSDCCCQFNDFVASSFVEGWEGRAMGGETEDCCEVGGCFGEIDVI